MTIDRASVLLPCPSWDDFPTHLGQQASAELLAAWTSLWHPALVSLTGRLPAWHPTDEPPEPTTLENELVLVPPPSRVRIPADWCDRLRATAPANPPPVETVASRAETVRAVLQALDLSESEYDAHLVSDFFALGFAYLHVDLLTRSMRYSSVLDEETFESALAAAAQAAVARNHAAAHEELARAFDLLADARNHVYSVDFYVVDVTLVADSTLGAALRSKISAGSPTSLLITAKQIERMAAEEPSTLSALKEALESQTVSVVGGRYDNVPTSHLSPEALLADFAHAHQVANQHLGQPFEVFGQFDSSFTHLLPEVLKGLGFRGALHISFDGARLPRADQRKTNWGASAATSIEALSATPLDSARAETWLQFAERASDTIARDHVATVVLAGWPGTESEYLDDLRHAARFGTVLGKLVTLDEYFRVSREADEWTTFFPSEYPPPDTSNMARFADTLVDAYQADVRGQHQQLASGLATTIADFVDTPDSGMNANPAAPSTSAVLNPWNFDVSYLLGVDPISGRPPSEVDAPAALLADVLGCGYARLTTAIADSPAPLTEELTLRNERLEVTISRKTGGIQSVRTHRDRNTRVSQRLVFYHGAGSSSVDSRMVADRVQATRQETLLGEITSTGRILDDRNTLLARFTQRVRVARGLGPVFVDLELAPERLPDGDPWKSYFASRLAWSDDALSVRRGQQWTARETEREQIVTPEFVDIDDVLGRVTCFPFGLPLHRRSAPNWLDTLLVVAGQQRRRFQFALAIDQPFPSRVALATLSANQPYRVNVRASSAPDRAWLLHLGAKNLVLTHIAPLPLPARGVRLRVLETEGRETDARLSAFRPLTAARTTDFRSNPIEVLSVTDGRASFDIGPYQWLQLEAEW